MGALIGFAGTFTSACLSDQQLGLARWELEKYGLAFHEPFAEQALAEGLANMQGLAPADGPRFAVAHGCEILRRRGRGILELAIAASARVAALGARTNPHLDTILFDVSSRSYGQVSFDDVHMGSDEIADFEMDHQLPVRANAAELAAQTRLACQLLAVPTTWTPAHALAFLIVAAHFSDRSPCPLPENATAIVTSFARIYSVDPVEALAKGEQLYRECYGQRFVVMRVVDDQLMAFARLPLDLRKTIVQIVNQFAAGDLTPWRRAIVTAAMAVLATSPKALDRERHCPEWPVFAGATPSDSSSRS
jgi:hypothetical protein